jgi:superfamily II DNA or RNA helicase
MQLPPAGRDRGTVHRYSLIGMRAGSRDLLKSFDETTIARGLRYAADGAVIMITEQQRGVIARVKGTRRTPYSVHIPFGDGPSAPLEPASAVCTCPMGVMCKHIVATTVVYYGDDFRSLFDEDAPSETTADVEERRPWGGRRTIPFPVRDAGTSRPPSSESLLEQLGRLMRMPAPSPDTVLPIERSAKPRHSSQLEEYFAPPPVPRTAKGERWRLVFIAGDRPQLGWRQRPSLAAHADTRRVFIAPASQYIRKDGKPGRIEKYHAERRHEPADAGAEALLEKLAIDGGEAPLLLHLDHLLAHSGLPVYPMEYDGRSSYGHPLQLARIERVLIAFLPESSESLDRGDVRVRPAVRVELEHGSGADHAVETAWVDAWGGRLVALAGSRWLGWCDRVEERLLGIVCRLAEWKPVFDLAELAELREKVEAEKSSVVALDLPYRSVRLVTPQPQPDLLLREQPDGTTAHLAFRYPSEGDLAAPGKAAGDEWVVLHRNRAFEGNVVQVLQALFLAGNRSVRSENRPWDEPGLWRFRKDMGAFLAAFGEELLSRGISLSIEDRSHRLTGTGVRLQVRVSSGIDWFDLAVSAGEDLDLSRVHPNDPLLARGFIRTGERIVYIGAEEAEKLRRLIALLDPSQRGSRVSRHDLEAAARLQELVAGTPPLELKRASEISRALSAPGAFADTPPPTGFRGKLRDYQRVGLGWLAFLAEHGLNGCLADDMGLGKTVQALALVLHLKAKDAPGVSLVIAPVSTLRNWENEAARFAPALRVVVHHGSERQRGPDAFDAADLVIVSYATLRVDRETFQAREWAAVILDEAQSIKNPASQSFAAVKTLRSRHRFTLTGTPLENSAVDLWAQFDFLEPGLLGSLQRFRRRFGGAASDGPDPERQRLRRIVRPFILRRTKEVVEKSLPPREEIRLLAEMGPRQKAAYDALKEGYRARIVEAIRARGVGGCGALVFEGLLRLRQAACIPAHAGPSLKGLPSAKLELLEDVLEEIVSESHRVLVFSQFVQTLDAIGRMLDDRGHDHVRLDGSTRNRQEVVDRFQADPRVPVFLLSLRAGGLGINLTAADYVIIFDPWWNPAVERQAVDRSHRIGQHKPVFVYRLITRDSIEERILALQDTKRALAADLIEENPRSLLSLGEEELVAFFS